MNNFQTARKYTYIKTETKPLHLLIFYPTDAAETSLDRFTKQESKTLSQTFMKPHTTSEIESLTIETCDDSPLSKAINKFPIVFFCAPSIPSAHQDAMRQIASKGYIVISQYHSDTSIMISSESQGPNKITPNYEDRELSITNDFVTLYHELFGNVDYFSGAIDWNKCHVVGYSLGGSAAYRIGSQISSVKSCTNIDGSLFGSEISELRSTPLLMIEHDPEHSNESDEDIQKHKNSIRYIVEDDALSLKRIKIKGTNHHSFSDLSYLTEIENANPNTLNETIECILSFIRSTD